MDVGYSERKNVPQVPGCSVWGRAALCQGGELANLRSNLTSYASSAVSHISSYLLKLLKKKKKPECAAQGT